jgi:hypothetical protein
MKQDERYFGRNDSTLSDISKRIQTGQMHAEQSIGRNFIRIVCWRSLLFESRCAGGVNIW